MLSEDQYLVRKMLINMYYDGLLDVPPEKVLDQEIIRNMTTLAKFVGINFQYSFDSIEEFPLPLTPISQRQDIKLKSILGESYNNISLLDRLIDGFETKLGLNMLVMALKRYDNIEQLRGATWTCADFTDFPVTPHQANAVINHLIKII